MKAGPNLKLNTEQLKPGMRLAAAVSGGADSVALLLALTARAGELGLVLSVAHLHHGLRGAEADADLEFVRELAERLGLPFVSARVDTGAEAARARESVEEAARRLRYGWFRGLMAGRREPVAGSYCVDAVATAHTLDDQAETVLAKFLRGAWTQGLSGIHPVVEFQEGPVLRPLLETTRAEVEAYLKELGQEWREDSTNRQVTFTRNRIRHELLPLLESWNPNLKEHLAQMAWLARDEDAWWEAEAGRMAEGILRKGKPARGGGRAASEGLALDLARLAALDPAVQRRVLRLAAREMGFAPDFSGTEALRKLALAGRAGQQCELAGGLRAERTHRELRLVAAPKRDRLAREAADEVRIPVPGEGESTGFGVRVRIEVVPAGAKATCCNQGENVRVKAGAVPDEAGRGVAVLRNWKPGDRVRLRHSAGPKKVKEILERLEISGLERAHWPVLELEGRILWMRGVVVEPDPDLTVVVTEVTGTAERPPS